jgi:ABC-type dipeptide/oligopeptide/nickel transport system permease component
MIGLQFGNMMASAVVIETLFARMGIGRLLVLAILQRDYPLIQGIILVFGIIYIISNLIIDVLYSMVDPRIHYA